MLLLLLGKRRAGMLVAFFGPLRSLVWATKEVSLGH